MAPVYASPFSSWSENDAYMTDRSENKQLSSPKRKAKSPQRSIPHSLVSSEEKKSKMGIVKLDVYSLFKANPKKLLYNREYYGSIDSLRQLHARGQNSITRAGSMSPMLQSGQDTPTPSNNSISPRLSNSANSPPSRGGKRRGRPPSSFGRSGGRDANVSGYRRSSPPAANPLMTDENGKPIVTWPKSHPLQLTPNDEGYELLTEDEVQTCSILRLQPMQYIKVRDTLIAHRELKGFFRKREAQKLCRIDVNKTGKLYDWFAALGWISGDPEDAKY